jgi:murein DD-endopeptidase MepM/ murein hydrolase activator NlpD
MRIIVVLCLLLTRILLVAQYHFRSPIDAEIKLASNCGELRENHFHSGLDILTNGEEGWIVYAIGDGYVSRILISKNGYGNALYISHPNGLTSVYGHLSRYNEEIKKFATACQYAHENFELDTLLPPDIITVKSGDIVAYSGNTGGSQGPHLHFEIRDTKTEFVLNPENFGFEINDFIAPKIYSVSLFTLNGYQSKFLQTLPLINGKTITVEPGRVGIGISGRDFYTGYQFNAGIYQEQLYVNDELIFEKRMDTFSFDHWRCINAHIDYEILKSKGYYIEKCFKDDGNLSEIYYNLVNNGIIKIAPSETLQIKIIARDHTGNKTQIAFTLKGGYENKKPMPKYNVVPNSKNEFNAKKAFLTIPPGAVYDTLLFPFYADTTYRRYSYKYIVGAAVIPIQKEIELKIIPLVIPKAGVQKLFIRSLSSGSVGGIYSNGYMIAKTRSCGSYIVDLDTTPPNITPVNIPYNKNISKNSTLKFLIFDSQTGVKKFKATANGKFILFSYDLKYNLITCNLEDVNLSGQTDFELVVEDGCGNIKRYKTIFTKN